jgi:Zn-dependent M28 family amino/carboxypeptidase
LLVVTFPETYAQRTQRSRRTQPTRSTAVKTKKATSITERRGFNTIAADQLRDYLTFIASDEMEGRDTPSRGLDTTAKFIALNLHRWGFKPAGDDGTFFQHIELRRNRVDTDQTKVEFNGRALTAGPDFLPTSAGTASGSLVFAGTGWLIKSKQIDAYKDVDPSGKIAVIFGRPNQSPRGISRAELGKIGEDSIAPVEYARQKGVAGIIYVPDAQYLANWQRSRLLVMERGSIYVARFQIQQAVTSLPAVIVSPDVVKSLFEGEREQADSILNPTSVTALPAPFLLSDQKKITLSVANTADSIPTQNVVAVWEGSDPVLKSEYVAFGAHYDHVGSGCPPVGNDRICNGADDDGSGTTALLGMAEALAKAPVRPKRSILFVWHCGEEKGLWGSRYFTEFPTVPLDHVVAQINIDMIGRTKKDGDTNPRNAELTGPNAIYLIGSTMMSTELGELVNAVNKSFLNLTFDTRYDAPTDPNRFFFRSDHYNYARKGIPIIFFFDGVHEDYHRAGDTADKIDYQKMERVTRTIYMTAWEIANRPARLKVDKPLPKQLSGSD